MSHRGKPGRREDRPDTVALVIAALQVVLPFLFAILAAATAAYLVFAAFFR